MTAPVPDSPQAVAGRIRVALDEQERLARAAAPSPWTYGDIESVAGGSLYDESVMIASLHWDNPAESIDPRIRKRIPEAQADATGEHIAAHDPETVLADVADKRERVERDLAQVFSCAAGAALASLAGLHRALGLGDVTW